MNELLDFLSKVFMCFFAAYSYIKIDNPSLYSGGWFLIIMLIIMLFVWCIVSSKVLKKEEEKK